MSWVDVGGDSTSWTAVGRDNGYVVLDYVVDFYIDQDESFTVVSPAGNTWSAA